MNTGIRRAGLSVGLAFALAVVLLGVPPETAAAPPSTTDRPAPTAVSDTAVGNLPDVAPPTIESGPNEAELQDLAMIAEQEGITLDRAIARYAWNDNFTVALEEIRAVSGDLAEAAITEHGTAWVAFAEEVPVEAVGILARFAAAHPAVDLDVRTGAGFTELAFEDALVGVHTAIYDTPGVREAVTSYDRPARQIVTTVSLLPGVDPDLVATLRAVSAARLAEEGGQGIADVLSTRVVLLAAGLTGDDSGGPWFSGNTAYGIHKGSHCDPFCPYERDLFTKATRLDDGLGVFVAVS